MKPDRIEKEFPQLWTIMNKENEIHIPIGCSDCPIGDLYDSPNVDIATPPDCFLCEGKPEKEEWRSKAVSRIKRMLRYDLTLEELYSTTWDCAAGDFLGFYKEHPVWRFMFYIPKARDPEAVSRCNLKEGWVEEYRLSNRVFNESGVQVAAEYEKDSDGYLLVDRYKFNWEVNIINDKNETIVRISKFTIAQSLTRKPKEVWP